MGDEDGSSNGDSQEVEEKPLSSDPDWMTDSDEAILDVLMTELTLTPSIIAENADISRVTVNNRLNVLQARDLVNKVERGKYEITKQGAFVVTGNPTHVGIDPDDS